VESLRRDQADWQAPPPVRAFVTTRKFGDLNHEEARRELRRLVPAEPAWLNQVHGNRVVEIPIVGGVEADAAVARKAKSVLCRWPIACRCSSPTTAVAAAHAGWRGLAGGVLEATVAAMRIPGHKLIAWLGPAIGPRAYEVGEDVLAAFRGHEAAFSPARPGHWRLDLYAIARQRLSRSGVRKIHGGGLCTYSDSQRFFSYRRDGTSARMGAFIWLA
jgi:YfiH family protein